MIPNLSLDKLCAAEGWAGEVTHALWGGPEGYEWIPDNWTLSFLHFWSSVLLYSDCDYALALSYSSKKVFNSFYKSPQFGDFEFKKTLDFKDTAFLGV